MNKFWEWMKNKNYISDYDNDGGFIEESWGGYYLEEVFLIGPMIEYLIEQEEKSWMIDIGICWEDKNINNLYSILEKAINNELF